MRFNFFYGFLSLMLIALFFPQCRKDLHISDVPSITFDQYYKLKSATSPYDSLVIVDIDFEDGDGDFGLSLSDTASPFRIGDAYFNNVFVEYLRGNNGVYTHQVTGTSDTLNYNDRVTDLKPESRVKAILGTLHIKVSPTITSGAPPDSIKLNVFIVDRQLHRSNTLSIGPIPVNF
jgi:hypothetical protein